MSHTFECTTPFNPRLQERAVEIATWIGHRIADAADFERISGIEDEGGYNATAFGTGNAGAALLLAALAQLTHDGFWMEAAHEHLARSVVDLPAHPSLFSGAASPLLSALIVRPSAQAYRGMIRALGDRVAELLAATLSGPFSQPKTTTAFDLINGVAGTYVALLATRDERYRPELKAAESYFRWLLEDEGSGRSRWCTETTNLGSSDRYFGYNIGMAHGICGLLAALVMAVDGEPREDLIDAIGDWLCSNAVVKTAFGPEFAGHVSLTESPSISRVAWCYGTPSVAVTLARAAEIRGRKDWAQVARASVDAVVARPLGTWGLSDHSICHGTIGVALVLSSLPASLRNAETDDLIARLLQETVDAFDASLPMGYGYRASRAGRKVLVAAPGVLEGASGIGLALLTLVGLCKRDWLYALGLSGDSLQ